MLKSSSNVELRTKESSEIWKTDHSVGVNTSSVLKRVILTKIMQKQKFKKKSCQGDLRLLKKKKKESCN